MRKDIEKSDSRINAIFLSMSGGLQDAYTYFLRGNVFANAQTGNIVLMSSCFFKFNLKASINYIIPLSAFAVGVFVTELIHYHYKKMEKIHWRQLILIAEIILLFIVGFIPKEFDSIANAIVSFVCAMQVQSFKKVNGRSYASTMCIGNMRSAMEALCGYFNTKDKKQLESFLEYCIIIFLFAIGAGIGYVCTNILGIKAIWISCIFLFVSFCIMSKNNTTKLIVDKN